MKSVNRYILTIACVIFCLLSTIDGLSFFKPFYEYEANDLNTCDVTKMSKEDLDKTYDVLLGYLKGEYESLDLKLSIDGEVREVFNAKEKEHMVDVLKLYQNAMSVRNVAFIIMIISLIIELCLKIDYKAIRYAYINTLKVTLATATGFMILALVDFDFFWTNFHKVFFENDLWLLDPKTDILINLVPGQFFNHLVLLIIVVYGLILGLIYILLKKLEKRS